MTRHRRPQKETKKQAKPAELLFSNAAHFLNGGIELLFSQTANDQTAKLAVVAIQTAMELLAKYRLVQASGIESIIEGKLPPGPIMGFLKAGEFRTLGYFQTLKALENEEPLNDMDRDLIQKVAALRNRLVHFSAELDLEDIRITAAHLVLKGLNRFAAVSSRDVGNFQNHGTILSQENFHTLVNFGPYRAEAVDDALDSIDGGKVLRCWECGVDALRLGSFDTYFCHCCGLMAEGRVAKFAPCCICDKPDAVVYDPMNKTHGMHDGKCLYCGERLRIWECKECGAIGSQLKTHPRKLCGDCDNASNHPSRIKRVSD